MLHAHTWKAFQAQVFENLRSIPTQALQQLPIVRVHTPSHQRGSSLPHESSQATDITCSDAVSEVRRGRSGDGRTEVEADDDDVDGEMERAAMAAMWAGCREARMPP
jgi:hypothetical protein